MHGMTGKRRAKPAARKIKPPERPFPPRDRAAADPAPAFATLRISGELDAALRDLAERTGRPKSYHVRKALERHLEDSHDYLDAEAASREPGKTISLQELKKRLGLAD
jgi:RHH-type rel operon transcriptional repressor/antitoxin RelB